MGYPYAKVTLTSSTGEGENDELSVDVYLPEGLNNRSLGESVYYRASRFEHGSMIGNIRYKGHVLYGPNLWRMPHNSNWPESGLGLASEFGVGDNGDFCFYRCGWQLTGDITNGVLGYREAKLGQAFLKVGVGALIKGSCPACDSTEDYKFNSPYLFASTPKWTMDQKPQLEGGSSPQELSLFHEAYLRNLGYDLRKDIALEGNVLTVTTTLTNRGTEAFSTVWYSHNFFHCDGVAVGPGYSINLELSGKEDPLYEEPGTWSWSTPLAQYADVETSSGDDSNGGVSVRMTRALDPGIRIKTEFRKDETTTGGFTLDACGTRLTTELEPGGSGDYYNSPLEMYAYNLYLERGTFSPEPQILLHLQPGQSRQWTQRVTISSLDSVPPNELLLNNLVSTSASVLTSDFLMMMVGAVACCFVVASILYQHWWSPRAQKRRQYSRISEAEAPQFETSCADDGNHDDV